MTTKAWGYLLATMYWLLLLVALGLCWPDKLGFTLPAILAQQARTSAMVATGLGLLAAVLSLWLSGRLIQASSGYDRTMLGFVLWFSLPYSVAISLDAPR